jgi:hypothetical protein
MDEGSQYIKGESGTAESHTPFLILVRYNHLRPLCGSAMISVNTGRQRLCAYCQGQICVEAWLHSVVSNPFKHRVAGT